MDWQEEMGVGQDYTQCGKDFILVRSKHQQDGELSP